MAKILKVLWKNIVAFLIGAAIGTVTVVLFVFPSALKESLADKEPGTVIVGAIALAPVLLIIYGVLGIIFGGLAALIVYNIAKLVLRKKKPNI